MPPTQKIQQDLSGGSNVVTNPYIIGGKQAILLTNVLLDEHGSIRTRGDSHILGTSPDAAPRARPIVKLYNFVHLVYQAAPVPPTPPAPPPAPPVPPPGPPDGGPEIPIPNSGGGDGAPSGGEGGGGGDGDGGDGGE